ncbi:MAG: TIGR01777 family oxidoreductase, partial [Candidatus Paceibacterota bacterium]
MKICITGGSGFIGYKLAQLLVNEGHTVLILDINPPYQNMPGIQFIKSNLVDDIPLDEYLSCDTVIHLAGINIFSRWTNEYKKLILSSRVETAKALIEAVRTAGKGPKSFISSSAVGYYGDAGGKELTEIAPAGDDFLANVCLQWENIAKTSEEIGMRWVSIRTGIVIGAEGGILQKLLPIFSYCLGGPLGNGKQWFSWIFIDDLLNIYKIAVFNNNISGPVNATSPNPI